MYFLSFFGAYDFLARNSLIVIVAAVGVYIMLNAGLFAVPQVGFMSIGAYASALLSVKSHQDLAVTLIASTAAGAIVGLVLGVILARLNGVYLAIATIGFSEMVRVVIQNLHVTGGPTGLVGIEQSLNDIEIVLVLAGVMLLITGVNRTRYGKAMTAMREDTLMAAHQGINVRMSRIALFVASGAISALAGGMQVHLTGFVEPSGFSFDLLVTLLTATIVGGMANVCGPLIGGAVVMTLSQLLLRFQDYRQVVNGALMILIIAFAAKGLVPLANSFGEYVYRSADRAWRSRKASAAVVSAAESVLAKAEEDQAAALRPAPRAAPVSAAASDHDDELILKVDGLSKSFGGVRAVRDLSLELGRGQIFGIIGPNGSGKTSLLNLLSGVYTPDAGTGAIQGSPMNGLWGRPERLTKAGISRTFQNIRLIDDATVQENVRLGAFLGDEGERRRPWSRRPAAVDAEDTVLSQVDYAIDMVGIADVVTNVVGDLPYGLKRKVEIARALARRPVLLLLDEPTAGMTPTERDEIFELIQVIRAGGTTVVVIEHDVSSITKHCDQVAVLNFGQIIALGEPAEIIGQEAVIDAYIGRTART
jgi:branched-chain amino acid transport system permease protein